MREEYIISIDPDITESGVTLLHRPTRNIEVFSFSFPQLIDFLMIKRAQITAPTAVVIEAGWINKGNWHLSYKDNRGQASAKGYHVGRNHETGIKLCEMARHFGYNVIEFKPLRKCWKGKDGKITHEELNNYLDAFGIEPLKRNNQDERDSVLIAMSYANLPQVKGIRGLLFK